MNAIMPTVVSRRPRFTTTPLPQPAGPIPTSLVVLQGLLERMERLDQKTNALAIMAPVPQDLVSPSILQSLVERIESLDQKVNTLARAVPSTQMPTPSGVSQPLARRATSLLQKVVALATSHAKTVDAKAAEPQASTTGQPSQVPEHKVDRAKTRRLFD